MPIIDPSELAATVQQQLDAAIARRIFANATDAATRALAADTARRLEEAAATPNRNGDVFTAPDATSTFLLRGIGTNVNCLPADEVPADVSATFAAVVESFPREHLNVWTSTDADRDAPAATATTQPACAEQATSDLAVADVRAAMEVAMGTPPGAEPQSHWGPDRIRAIREILDAAWRRNWIMPWTIPEDASLYELPPVSAARASDAPASAIETAGDLYQTQAILARTCAAMGIDVAQPAAEEPSLSMFCEDAELFAELQTTLQATRAGLGLDLPQPAAEEQAPDGQVSALEEAMLEEARRQMIALEQAAVGREATMDAGQDLREAIEAGVRAMTVGQALREAIEAEAREAIEAEARDDVHPALPARSVALHVFCEAELLLPVREIPVAVARLRGDGTGLGRRWPAIAPEILACIERAVGPVWTSGCQLHCLKLLQDNPDDALVTVSHPSLYDSRPDAGLLRSPQRPQMTLADLAKHVADADLPVAIADVPPAAAAPRRCRRLLL